MSQAGYTPIQLYYSTTAAAAPSAGNLAAGELAVNITDGKLFYKDNGGVVRVLATAAGSAGDVVGPGSSTDNALVRFDGTTGKLVQNSAGVLDDSGNLTGIAALTTSGALTLNGGTTNGVAYLNGSKVLTTGSALTFDGTNLATTGGVFLNNAQYFYSKTSGGTNIRMLGINSGNTAYVGPIDSGPGDTILNASASSANIQFYAAGSEQMRLTSTGLGIGTSSLNATYAPKLQVESSASNGTGGVFIGSYMPTLTLADYSASAAYGQIRQDGNNLQFIADVGDAASNSYMTWCMDGPSYEKMRMDVNGILLVNQTAQVSNNVASRVAILAGTDSSSTTIQTMPQGLSISNSTNQPVSGYGVAMRFQFSSGSDGVGKYAAIAGIAEGIYANTTALAFYTTANATGGTDNVAERGRFTSGGAFVVADTTSQYSAKIYANGSIAARNGAADGNYQDAFLAGYTSNYTEKNIIQTAVSSAGTGSGFRFKTSDGAGSSGTTTTLDLNRTQTIFYTGGAQTLIIDANQRVQLGSSTALYSASLTIKSASNSYIITSSRVGGGTGTLGHIVFENDNGAVGTIQTNGSSTIYNTSSDYRLKNITGPITNSGAYIDSLKPCEGTWKADGTTFVGLVAHEAQEVSRTTVASGTKDGEEMQGMDYGNAEFIANIIAELQSLRKRVAQLEQGA